MKLFQSPVTVGKSIARWVGGFTSKQLKWEKTQLQQEWSSKTRSLWTVYRNVVGVYLHVEMSLSTPQWLWFHHIFKTQPCKVILCNNCPNCKITSIASISYKHILQLWLYHPQVIALKCSTNSWSKQSYYKKAVCPDERCSLVIAICSTAWQLCLRSFKCSPDLPSLCIPLFFLLSVHVQ